MTLITLPPTRRRRTLVHRRATASLQHVRPPYHADSAPITHIIVAVPARNESASIGACLDSIDLAAASTGLSVVAVVAADSCTDASATLARAHVGRWMTTRVVEGTWRSASGARAAAVATGLTAVGALPPASVWIANTDADCVVPADWLLRQLRHCGDTGVAVAGIVALDVLTTDPAIVAGFAQLYDIDGPVHRHVHGANLGLRADAYAAAGGWRPRAVLGEDHDLWRRLAQAGVARAQPTDIVVTTSSRQHGRLPGGFAGNLRRLARVLADE